MSEIITPLPKWLDKCPGLKPVKEDGAIVIRAFGGKTKWRSDCGYCQHEMESDFFPYHDASNFCESGKHNHCTCDTCF
jgi:hypothetical protein